jgi:hypothetical protein
MWSIDKEPMSRIYEGFIYAYLADGGFFIDKSFNMIRLAQENQIYQFDSTTAVQVTYDVRKFNEKLGLIKDASNQFIIQSPYNPLLDEYPTDSVTITADDFIAEITSNNILSLGKLTTLYNDYVNYVNSYFSFPAGFHTLLSSQSNTDTNNGTFDVSDFLRLLQPVITGHGDTVTTTNGSITIYNINASLRYAVDTNAFGNRDPSSNTAPYSSDPVNTHNFGLGDGFMADDLVYAPTGISIGLNTVMKPNFFTQVATPNDIVSAVTTENYQNLVANTDAAMYNTILDPSANLLQRTITVPLLIKLV